LGARKSHVGQGLDKKEQPMRPAEKGNEKDQTNQQRPFIQASAALPFQGQGWETLRRMLIDQQSR